jgi:hypothetical protein
LPRAPAAPGVGEELAGHPGAAPVVGVVAVVGLISLPMLIDGDGSDERPTSP